MSAVRIEKITKENDKSKIAHARKEIEAPTVQMLKEAQSNLSDKEKAKCTCGRGGFWRDTKGRLVLSSESRLVDVLLVAAHQGESGHRGLEMTKQYLRKYIWTTKERDIRNFVAGCMSCLYDGYMTKVPRPLAQQVQPTRPEEIITVDYLNICECDEGFKYLLVLKDTFTREVQLVATRSTDAYTAARGLMNWMTAHDTPTMLISDGGSAFRSSLIRTLCETLHFKQRITTPYHSESHGSVERCNREVLRLFRRLLHEFNIETRYWYKLVPLIEYRGRNSLTSFFFIIFPRFVLDCISQVFRYTAGGGVDAGKHR